MKDVNRFAVVVQPKQALLDWVNTIFPDSPVSLALLEDDGGTVYLIPEFISMLEARTWLRKHFKPILEQELEEWCTDPALWPALSWKTFASLLDYRIYSMIIDASALSNSGRKQGSRGSAGENTNGDALEIEISLDDTLPRIWRRALIAPHTTFLELHYIIQFAMGWTNSHLHHFIIGQDKTYIGIPFLNELDGDILYVNSTITRVGNYLKVPQDHFAYEYDFGDGWRHTITLLKRGPRLPGITLPLVLDGARACPPEDCGGVGGYQDIVVAMKKPRSRAAKDYTDWLGTRYDPEYFDLNEVNQTYFKNFRKTMAEWEAYAAE